MPTTSLIPLASLYCKKCVSILYTGFEATTEHETFGCFHHTVVHRPLLKMRILAWRLASAWLIPDRWKLWPAGLWKQHVVSPIVARLALSRAQTSRKDYFPFRALYERVLDSYTQCSYSTWNFYYKLHRYLRATFHARLTRYFIISIRIIDNS